MLEVKLEKCAGIDVGKKFLAEAQIFRVLLDGQHMIRGFSNPDIRQKLQDSPHLKVQISGHAASVLQLLYSG